MTKCILNFQRGKFIPIMADHTTLTIPDGYKNVLPLLETQKAIKLIKDTFEKKLADALHLIRVSAPLIVLSDTGINDNLNGYERPVEFDIKETGNNAQIVQSLAKWKRIALAKYEIKPREGLYTDMNAIRRDEIVDNIHSIYVDQWDWEKVILPEERNFSTLKTTVEQIRKALYETETVLLENYPDKHYSRIIPETIHFVTSQELEDLYPDKTPKERETLVAKEYRAVFISQIGGKLKSGNVHDGRSPDYDDWTLNGDIIVWYEPLQIGLELSSMGIRVDPESLKKQLKESGCEDRLSLEYHSLLVNGKLPLTIGGGIGQSRICMCLLHTIHIGEVQSSIWPDWMVNECKAKGIQLL